MRGTVMRLAIWTMLISNHFFPIDTATLRLRVPRKYKRQVRLKRKQKTVPTVVAADASRDQPQAEAPPEPVKKTTGRARYRPLLDPAGLLAMKYFREFRESALNNSDRIRRESLGATPRHDIVPGSAGQGRCDDRDDGENSNKSSDELRRIAYLVRRGSAAERRKRRPGSVLQGPPFAGVTSMEDFDYERDIGPVCRSGDLSKAMKGMPLNLPSGLYPKHFGVTQRNVPSYVRCDDRTKWAWSRIQPYLSASPDKVYGSSKAESCAIVGNSGNLLLRQYGDEIESHEWIWRFNLAPTGDPYSLHVGNRTSFRVINNKNTMIYALNGHARLMRHGDGTTWALSSHVEDVPWDRGATLIISRMTLSNITEYLPYLNRTVLYNMKKRMWSKNDQKLTWNDRRFFYHSVFAADVFRRCQTDNAGQAVPQTSEQLEPTDFSTSTGLMTTLAALHLCGNVSVYGMGEPEQRGPKFHYYPDNFVSTKPEGMEESYGAQNSDAHDFKLEQDFLRELGRAGMIRHCTVDGCIGRAPPPHNGKLDPRAEAPPPGNGTDFGAVDGDGDLHQPNTGSFSVLKVELEEGSGCPTCGFPEPQSPAAPWNGDVSTVQGPATSGSQQVEAERIMDDEQ